MATAFFPFTSQTHHFAAELTAQRAPIPSQPANTDSVAKETLLDILNDNHGLYHIEYQDHLPNILSHALVSGYELGAPREQLLRTYHRLAPDLERLRLPEIRITSDNWTEYLGQKRYYREYLNYFDAHIAKNSLSTTFQTHFPRLLPGCIGSSLHPLIHLGLGLDLAHTHLVSEGLAYACIAYSPIGELIDTQNGANAADVDPREILEMVRVDKRFDGVFDGAFGAKLKVLAKSRGALLKVYMDELNIEAATTPDAMNEKLHSLTTLSTLLLTTASTHTTTPSTPAPSPHSTSPTMAYFPSSTPPMSPRALSFLSRPKLDIHLASIFSSLQAVYSILPHLPSNQDRVRLLKLQWLATLCIYVVQGRPTIRDDLLPSESSLLSPRDSIDSEYSTWERCTKTILDGSDTRAPTLLRGLLKSEERYGAHEDESLYLRAAGVLAEFVGGEGGWDHKGVGW